jgi:lysophospholipase L1-like esterase
MKLSIAVMLLLFICLSVTADEQKSRGCIPVEKDVDKHEQYLKNKQEALKTGPIQLVFIGDSITDGWRWAGGQTDIFKERYAKYNPYNIGVGGDETQHVLWRIQHGELDGITPKLAILLIGTNNIGNANQMSVDETVDGIKCVVNAIKEKLPESKILLIGIFPRGAEPTDRYRGMIKSINEKIATLDDGGKTLKFLDIGDKLQDADGRLSPRIMPDALHVNVKGYKIWADAMQSSIDEMMK